MLLRRLCTSLSRPNTSTLLTLSPRPKPHHYSLRLRHRLYTSKMGDTNTAAQRAHHLREPTKPELLRSLESTLGSTFSSDPIFPKPSPIVLVISGPSGVGKDAVIRRLREIRPGLHFVVTATTRPIRPGESDGVDYHFVTRERFLSMVDRDELLEYALVYGEYKGVPKSQIRDFMARGCDVVMRVDIQGAKTLRRILGDSAVFVFVVAESEAEMVERLVARRTESKEELLVRIGTAREEVKHLGSFDYVVVNAAGRLDEAVGLVGSIIDAEKAKVRQRSVVI